MVLVQLRLATDEDFDERIVRGLWRRNPNLDMVSVRDIGLSGQPDPVILEWTAQEDRVLLTHDVTTMSHYANERISNGLKMPGVIEVRRSIPMAKIITDILVIAGASSPKDWENLVAYLPL